MLFQGPHRAATQRYVGGGPRLSGCEQDDALTRSTPSTQTCNDFRHRPPSSDLAYHVTITTPQAAARAGRRISGFSLKPLRHRPQRGDIRDWWQPDAWPPGLIGGAHGAPSLCPGDASARPDPTTMTAPLDDDRWRTASPVNSPAGSMLGRYRRRRPHHRAPSRTQLASSFDHHRYRRSGWRFVTVGARARAGHAFRLSAASRARAWTAETREVTLTFEPCLHDQGRFGCREHRASGWSNRSYNIPSSRQAATGLAVLGRRRFRGGQPAWHQRVLSRASTASRRPSAWRDRAALGGHARH